MAPMENGWLRPRKLLLVLLLALPLSVVAVPPAGAVQEACAMRTLELRDELSRTGDAVTPALAAALDGAYAACALPLPRLPASPPVMDGCGAPASAQFEDATVLLTVSVLDVSRSFAEAAEAPAVVHVWPPGGHHTADVDAHGPTFGFYADNSHLAAISVGGFSLRGDGDAQAACGDDGSVCAAAASASLGARVPFKVEASTAFGTCG